MEAARTAKLLQIRSSWRDANEEWQTEGFSHLQNKRLFCFIFVRYTLFNFYFFQSTWVGAIFEQAYLTVVLGRALFSKQRGDVVVCGGKMKAYINVMPRVLKEK